MCGIFAYLNYDVSRERRYILQVLFNGLRRLEYRGYDSAWISIDSSSVSVSGDVTVHPPSDSPLVFRQEGNIKSLVKSVYRGNEGREYVLRRILRRAVRYGTEVLKAQQGFFNDNLSNYFKLVKVVVDVMSHVFPELKQQEAHIREVIADEEASFGRTLLHGIEKFKKTAQDVQGKIFRGQST